MTATPDDVAFLHDLIAEHFSDDELREVALEMGAAYDYENLKGTRKKDKAIELMRLAQRRNELPALLERLHEERPTVPWTEAVVPRLPLYERPRGKLIIGLGVLALLVAMAALLTWLYYAPSAAWATYDPVDPEALGIAVAELGVSADCRRGAAGREASALLYQTLEEQIRSVGLQRRAPLTKVGLVCNQEQAIEDGRRVDADLVIWGWVPESNEGILGQYTFVDPPEGVGAEALAGSLELLVGGPGQARFYRLTGRTESLVRFVLGLVYAKQKDFESSLTMFNRAIAIIEDDSDVVDNASLAVLYTERGKVQAAMDKADEAFVSYRKAESLNPDYIGLQIAFGAYYYSLREWDNARRYFRRAAQQQEPLPAIAYGLGLLEFYAGEYAAAVAQFQEAVERTLALDEEPILPWLGLGYAYSALGDCPASDAAFAAIVGSVSAEDDIRAAAEVETGRCERANVAAAAAPLAEIPTMMPTALAFAATRPIVQATGGALATPPPPLLICALRSTELRAGPGAEFAAAARLEAGGSAMWWYGDRTGNWLRVTLAPGFEVWGSAFDFTTCAGGTPWAATGVPPVVWPTSVGAPPIPTLLSTPAFAPTLTALPSPLATWLATPSPSPAPSSTSFSPFGDGEVTQPTPEGTSDSRTTVTPTLTETLLPSPTLLPTWPPTPTAVPSPTETLLPQPTPTAKPSPTETLLPEPSETFIPEGTAQG